MSNGRLIIFGGSGFVGGHLAATAIQQGWTVLVADTQHHPGLRAASWKHVDITNEEAVNQCIGETGPTAVVNVAALADIDRCQLEKELAWQINVSGARLVAQSCARYGIRHLVFSSDAVFNGRNGPYTETDQPDPLNYFGQTKAEAEKAILSIHLGAVLIRLSLVLGFPLTSGNSFLASLEEKLKLDQEIYCPVDEIRTPVDVHTLCQCVLELVSSSYVGLLHIGCTQSINRYELTRLVTQKMGYSTDLVRPQSSPAESPGRAPRHKNGILDVSRAQKLLNTRLPDLEGTIDQAIMDRPLSMGLLREVP